MIAWIKRKLREQLEANERYDAQLKAEQEFWRRARSGALYEFTPQPDITALELALMFRDFRPGGRTGAFLERVRVLEGAEMNPLYARHFSPIKPSYEIRSAVD